MQDKIFELIRYGAILLIGFSLGRLWVGRKVSKNLTDIKEQIDDFQIDRKKKWKEIEEHLDKFEDQLTGNQKARGK